jgi:hypothetical protein
MLSFFGLADPDTRLVVDGVVMHTPPDVETEPHDPPADLSDRVRLRSLVVAPRHELTLPRISVWPARALESSASASVAHTATRTANPATAT